MIEAHCMGTLAFFFWPASLKPGNFWFSCRERPRESPTPSLRPYFGRIGILAASQDHLVEVQFFIDSQATSEPESKTYQEEE